MKTKNLFEQFNKLPTPTQVTIIVLIALTLALLALVPSFGVALAALLAALGLTANHK